MKRISNLLIFVGILIVISIFIWMAQQHRGSSSTVLETKPATDIPKETIPVEEKQPEQARVALNIQSQIDLIVEKMDRGEITREEAQAQVNQILEIVD